MSSDRTKQICQCMTIYIYIYIVFANGQEGRVIPKTLKMILDTALLNIHQYKFRIKGKVEQSSERGRALPIHLGVAAIEKGSFGSPSTTVANFTYFTHIYIYI